MTIKTNDGEYNVTGAGQGTYNTVAGSLGLASFLGLGHGGGLLGGYGFNNNANGGYVSKEAFDLSIQLARKDSEIALLEAGKETDKKLVEVFNAAVQRDNNMRDRLEGQYRELDRKITEEREARMISESAQSVLNSQFQTGLTTLNGQVKSMQTVLAEITTSVIPANKVCDLNACGCNCGNN